MKTKEMRAMDEQEKTRTFVLWGQHNEQGEHHVIATTPAHDVNEAVANLGVRLRPLEHGECSMPDMWHILDLAGRQGRRLVASIADRYWMTTRQARQHLREYEGQLYLRAELTLAPAEPRAKAAKKRAAADLLR